MRMLSKTVAPTAIPAISPTCMAEPNPWYKERKVLIMWEEKEKVCEGWKEGMNAPHECQWQQQWQRTREWKWWWTQLQRPGQRWQKGQWPHRRGKGGKHLWEQSRHRWRQRLELLCRQGHGSKGSGERLRRQWWVMGWDVHLRCVQWRGWWTSLLVLHMLHFPSESPLHCTCCSLSVQPLLRISIWMSPQTLLQPFIITTHTTTLFSTQCMLHLSFSFPHMFFCNNTIPHYWEVYIYV